MRQDGNAQVSDEDGAAGSGQRAEGDARRMFGLLGLTDLQVVYGLKDLKF